MSEEEAEQIARARVGTVINGKWKVDRLIGVGGMASVYAATHRNSKRAALKIMHPELSAQASIRERFLREGYLSNLVDHPGVVTVDDDDQTEDGCAFLVMELVEGETLEARLRRKGPLPPEEVLSFMDQVLHALATAHTRGVVHRDLKPENILLAQTGEVKLLDFGIARARALSTDPTKTLTEGLMGTPAFMPPEQARGRWEEVDAQSDVWALGATMFTLLTGRNVHQAATTNEALALAMMRHAPRLEEYRPDLPSALVELVNKALAFEKKARWPNATVMLLAVRKASARLEKDTLEAEASAAALAVSADTDFEGYMPEEDEASSRPDAAAPEFRQADSEPSASESQLGTADIGYQSLAPERRSSVPAPVDELPTNPVSTSAPLSAPSDEPASEEPSADDAESHAPTEGVAAEEDALEADATPLATERQRAPLVTASEGAYPPPTSVELERSEQPAFVPQFSVDSSAGVPVSGSSAATSSPDASAAGSGPEAAARYLSRKASARAAEAADADGLPARRVVPFSDVPAANSEMVRPTETTTARGAVTAGVRSPNRNQRSLIGAIVFALLVLVVAVAAFGGDRDALPDPDALPEPAAAGEAVLEGDSHEPTAVHEAGQQALEGEPSAADPSGADADAEDAQTLNQAVSLETLPVLSASAGTPAPQAAAHRWSSKPKPEKTGGNIFNQAKTLAVKRATVRSDKVKSGKQE